MGCRDLVVGGCDLPVANPFSPFLAINFLVFVVDSPNWLNCQIWLITWRFYLVDNLDIAGPTLVIDFLNMMCLVQVVGQTKTWPMNTHSSNDTPFSFKNDWKWSERCLSLTSSIQSSMGLASWNRAGVECPNFVLKEHILQSLFDWTHALGGICSISLVDFIDFLSKNGFSAIEKLWCGCRVSIC